MSEKDKGGVSDEAKFKVMQVPGVGMGVVDIVGQHEADKGGGIGAVISKMFKHEVGVVKGKMPQHIEEQEVAKDKWDSRYDKTGDESRKKVAHDGL